MAGGTAASALTRPALPLVQCGNRALSRPHMTVTFLVLLILGFEMPEPTCPQASSRSADCWCS
jgi:hypothetical protein